MRARVFGVAAAIVALIGCDDGPRTITADDITPIPPGTAVGSVYSGDYVITGGAIEACGCRLGSCATLHVNVGGVATVTETDGTLEIGSANGGLTCLGGVDSDGSFRCDGALVQPGDVEFAIASGQFHAPNGQPASMTLTQEVTIAHAPYDCDLRVTLLSQYSGPPSALVATTPLPAPASAGAPSDLFGIALTH